MKSEVCKLCGKPYQVVYRLSDALWQTLFGNKAAWTVCPGCIEEVARKNGIFLYWEASEGHYPTDKHELNVTCLHCGYNYTIDIDHATRLDVCPVCHKVYDTRKASIS